MNTRPTALARWLCGAALITAVFFLPAHALEITRSSNTNLLCDFGVSPNLGCNYASYNVYNNDGVHYTNLWAKIDSFSGTNIRLGGGDPGLYNLGNLNAGQSNTVYVYLQATNLTSTPETHAVNIYLGRPENGGVLLTNRSFPLIVSDTAKNNASKVTAVVYGPSPPTLGGIVTIKINGETGVIGKGDVLSFTPASYTNWSAAAYEMVHCIIVLSNENAGTYSNRLCLSGDATPYNKNTPYEALYYFRAVGVAVAPTTVSPVTFVSHGQQIVHTDTGDTGYGSFLPIEAALNTTLLTNLADVTQLYTNELVTFTVRISNSGTNDTSLDRIVDTLPPSFFYVPGSTRFNGSLALDPDNTNQVLTWTERYEVPANSSRDLVFQASPTNAGYATNSVVGFTRDTQIDTSLSTSDSSPGTAIVRVLLEPTALDDAGSTFEDTVLTVPAPGVLDNDIEPNGFTNYVVSWLPPAHGAVTVNPDGSFTFTPATNYYGPDSFTYTVTNNNARVATATVSLTITNVNDPPALDALSPLALDEDAPEQTVSLTGISPGPANEANQLTVTATSSNPTLIPNPLVAYSSPNPDGTLTFTPLADANGTATITVIVTDDGGTGHGGVDAVTNTFQVTVAAVNDAPTLDALGPQTVDEGAPEQVLDLAGISAGPANESNQFLTITATSDNPSVVPHPTVGYTSPDTTGTLGFAPVTNAFGLATITVIVRDNGGTAGGGIDAVTNTFTVTVVALTNAWRADGSYTVEVENAAGPPGIGYTCTNYVGMLGIEATAANPFTIQVLSLSGGLPGPATNFDRTITNTWTIATTTRGVTGFDPDKFRVDDTGFTNDLAGGTFGAGLSADGLSVELVFSPNHPPVAGPVSIGRAWGTSLRIPVLNLVANYTSDPDGDGRALTLVNASTNGSWIATNQTYIYYVPTNSLSEAIQYVIRDTRNYRPGDTILRGTNWVSVVVTNAIGRVQTIAVGGPSVLVRFAGVPGFAYDVERSTNLAGGEWVVVLTTNAPARGVWEFVDADPPMPSAYYRIRQH